METYLLILIAILLAILIILFFRRKDNSSGDSLLSARLTSVENVMSELRNSMREEIRLNREELALQMKTNREEMGNSFRDFRKETQDGLRQILETNVQSLDRMNRTLEEKVSALIAKTEEVNRLHREETARQAVTQRESMVMALKEFGQSFEKSVSSFNDLQREKFSALEQKQHELVLGTEKKLEQMRATVEEKLEKTLSERLGQSFETVGLQLQAVQQGLGEMKNLAGDVGDLKKVLSNVKQRGGVGEIQLEMLLEQILAPEQYEADVRTKSGSSDQVEFAIKLPGREDTQKCIYLPVDAKFPKDAYEHLIDAYEKGDGDLVNRMNQQFENAIKKMAKDIRDKYIDPPNTTDFGIMFLPFESLYAEAVRRPSLMEQLQREFKIIVTGPMTLAAILNSLQMGFRTLALQKRSSEVWEVLGAVKTEFGKFGDLLDKAQKNIQTANNQLDEVIGKRTRAIQRRLKSVEALSDKKSELLLSDIEKEFSDEEV